MKKTLSIMLILTALADAQMPQTITTYGNNSFPQTTTIFPQPGGGYNYTRIGNGGPAWGGVTAAPGTTVSAAIGSRGGVMPIVLPKANYLDGINAQQDAAVANLEAQNAAMLAALPFVPRRTQQKEDKQLPKPKDLEAWHAFLKENHITPKSVVSISTYNNLVRTFNDLENLKKAQRPTDQFYAFYKNLSPSAKKEFDKQSSEDFGLKKGGEVNNEALLAYAKLWAKTHPQIITNCVAPALQKK